MNFVKYPNFNRKGESYDKLLENVSSRQSYSETIVLSYYRWDIKADAGLDDQVYLYIGNMLKLRKL